MRCCWIARGNAIGRLPASAKVPVRRRVKLWRARLSEPLPPHETRPCAPPRREPRAAHTRVGVRCWPIRASSYHRSSSGLPRACSASVAATRAAKSLGKTLTLLRHARDGGAGRSGGATRADAAHRACGVRPARLRTGPGSPVQGRPGASAPPHVRPDQARDGPTRRFRPPARAAGMGWVGPGVAISVGHPGQTAFAEAMNPVAASGSPSPRPAPPPSATHHPAQRPTPPCYGMPRVSRARGRLAKSRRFDAGSCDLNRRSHAVLRQSGETEGGHISRRRGSGERRIAPPGVSGVTARTELSSSAQGISVATIIPAESLSAMLRQGLRFAPV